ncbi:tail fiber assembly protein [Citrobacter freundii]|nr:tail fiber assembly protein [Citrobacter freundii]
MNYWFSPSNNAFYPEELKGFYIAAGSLPVDLVEVEEGVFNEFTSDPPAGKTRGVIDGMPAWTDAPLPTEEEAIIAAEAEKQARIDLANEYMNSKQWPGKAAIGRLKGDELSLYNLWLDYLDELEAVDTSTPQKIAWPESPEH